MEVQVPRWAGARPSDRRFAPTDRRGRTLGSAAIAAGAAIAAMALGLSLIGVFPGVASTTSRSTQATIPPPGLENPSWSGELAWASKNGVTAFDHVTGAWVQPSIAPASPAQYADTWVGVDGYDGKLLQLGTTAWTREGAVAYDAWFAAWTGRPSGMTVIDEPVAAGDHMQVTIDRSSSGTWYAKIEDATAGWTWSTALTYPANGSTAEWIEEAPGTWSTPSQHQALADYGSTTFTTVRADGAVPASVTAFDVAQGGRVVSYPSTYSATTASFTVHYGQPGAGRRGALRESLWPGPVR